MCCLFRPTPPTILRILVTTSSPGRFSGDPKGVKLRPDALTFSDRVLTDTEARTLPLMCCCRKRYNVDELQAQPHALNLCIQLKRVHAEFAAEAALLVAAKGRDRVELVVA